MTSLLRFMLVLVITAISGQAIAQSTSGAIIGTITDDKNEPVINATIQVTLGGISKGGTVTNFDGEYIIKPLEPGRYEVKVSYVGYKESIIQKVLVQPGQDTKVDAKLQPSSQSLKEVVITDYKIPLIDPYSGGSSTTKTAEELEKMPTRNTSSMVATSAGAYAQKDGGAVNIGGARSEGTLYVIDGVRVYGSRGINLSQGAIDQMQVITSGVPAKYGDAIGGVVTITTKGVSNKLRGNVLLEHSVDGYNHNLANVTLSGPLLRKKIDSVTKKPIVGFFLSGDAWYDMDRNPSFYGNYAVKDDVLKDIQAHPLIGVPNTSGVPVFRNRAETVTAKDLVINKRKQNAQIFEGRLTGRLDFQLADNLSLSAGGTFNYSKQKQYNPAWSLFAPNAIPDVFNYTGRGFLRLAQSFKKKAVPGMGEPEEKQIISNAYYTIQVDYQIDYQKIQHPKFGKDIFKYGYVGKFNTEYQPVYTPGIDSASSALYGTNVYGTRLVVDRQAVQTTYQRSDMNPLLANYTSQYYSDLDGPSLGDVQQIKQRNALINGQLPASIYNMYTTTGYAQRQYFVADVQQYSAAIDASFDLQPKKTRHSIEFGLYYQQRSSTSYSADAVNGYGSDIWQYMRQLTNSQIGLDRDNPIFIVDGKHYTMDQILGPNGITPSPSDTIFYNTKVIGTQSTFDKNLRTKLGVGPTDYINIDQLDPSVFSLDMFSADELLNSGKKFVNYRGYDYKGNRQHGQVNFNDFFTKKDANGNYTRDIGAFRPNYIAGYILDKFKFKDIFFNVGLRIERYDANTKVLKDPYSLYGVNTVSDAKKIVDNFGNPIVKNVYTDNGATPSNIGDNYVVYVNSNQSTSPEVVGYRDGDTWFDPYGRVIEDPTTLKQYTGGRDPQPYLVNRNVSIGDSTFDPNSSFTDYKPQVNLMPRISFNFPISDVAMFYAHYDVLVQRPNSNNVITTPADYFYLTNNQGSLINNPNLKPQKMFDYEVGFKQTLSKSSAITISGFYKERKNMIQVRPYLYAWPTTYYTYGNRDFSTVKGMMVKYELRRTHNLQLNINYTLQFANGSGSSATSSISGQPSSPGLLSNFVSAGLPNIRTVFPLDIDVRHNIVANIDYRYGKNEGPTIGDVHFLQNAGVNIIFRTRSGEPYTKYTLPKNYSNSVNGSVNGARLPWHYMFSLKLDKDFKLSFAKKDKQVTKPRRELYLNAYVLVTNLFNHRDILRVDGYTSRPDDDGYLTIPQGIRQVSNQYNPQSYVDLYSANLLNRYANSYVNLPRRINIGLNLNF